MNSIFQALNSGYPPQQILGFLSKAFPQLAPQISKATSAGYSAQKILGFLSKTVRNDIRPGMSETEIHSANKRHDAQLTKNGLMAVGGAIAAPIAGQVLGNALQRALPSSLQAGSALAQSPPSPTTPNIPGLNISPSANQQPGNPAGNNAIQLVLSQQTPITPPQSAGAPNIPQPPVSAQPLNPQRDIKKSVDILKNLGFEANVKNMLEGGLPPKDIAAALKTMMPKDKFKALEAQQGGIEGVINDYAEATQQQPQELAPVEPTSQELDEGKQAIEKAQEAIEPKPITKNSIVASPQGVGEVKEIRNGKAIIEVDGKLHKVDEKDLESPAFSDEDVADAYDNLMAKIQEEHKSGFISWAGYDEDRNVIGFIPRGGKYEELSDISPMEAQIIKDGVGTARTSGETREGLWVVGEDTRGGLISQIIHDRRRKREAEEKKQGKFAFELPKKEKEDKGMKPIFDEMAHARGLSQARDKAKKDKERAEKKAQKELEKARLKKVKDEAKKRKK